MCINLFAIIQRVKNKKVKKKYIMEKELRINWIFYEIKLLQKISEKGLKVSSCKM